MFLWPLGPWIDSVYWTLPIEIVFYAIFFILLSIRAFKRTSGAMCLLAVGSLVYWASLLGTQHWPTLPLLEWPRLLPSSIANLTLLPHGCYFALGGAFWLIFRYGPTPARAVLVIVALAGGSLQTAFFCRALSAATPVPAVEAVWIGSAVIMAFSIWKRAIVERYFGRYASAVRFLGLMTYPLYLIHDDAGVKVRDSLVRLGMPLQSSALLATCMALLAAAAIASLIEPAVQNVLRRTLTAIRHRGIIETPQPATQEPA
jgi:peptidoglycan/LPS O-acetylase OafA/YrhL